MSSERKILACTLCDKGFHRGPKLWAHLVLEHKRNYPMNPKKKLNVQGKFESPSEIDEMKAREIRSGRKSGLSSNTTSQSSGLSINISPSTLNAFDEECAHLSESLITIPASSSATVANIENTDVSTSRTNLASTLSTSMTPTMTYSDISLADSMSSFSNSSLAVNPPSNNQSVESMLTDIERAAASYQRNSTSRSEIKKGLGYGNLDIHRETAGLQGMTESTIETPSSTNLYDDSMSAGPPKSNKLSYVRRVSALMPGSSKIPRYYGKNASTQTPPMEFELRGERSSVMTPYVSPSASVRHSLRSPSHSTSILCHDDDFAFEPLRGWSTDDSLNLVSFVLRHQRPWNVLDMVRELIESGYVEGTEDWLKSALDLIIFSIQGLFHESFSVIARGGHVSTQPPVAADLVVAVYEANISSYHNSKSDQKE